jgi:hypothetical protein
VLKGTISSDNEDISPMINLERISLTMIRNLINDGNLFANTWPTNFITTDDYSVGNNVGGGFYIENPGTGYDAALDVINIELFSGEIGVGATGTPIVNGTGSLVGVTLTNSGNTYLHSPNVSITTGSSGTGGVIKYHGEDEPVGPGNFLARYMTKKVVMMPSAEATDVKVYLTASQPRGTKVWVYVKVKNKSDREPFNKKIWQLLARDQSYSAEITSDESVFREISFSGASNDGTFPLSYQAQNDFVVNGVNEQPSAQEYNTFNEFAIKIVMQSADPRIVPVVRDLRAVAVE